MTNIPDSWIREQTERNIAQFDQAMETHYPDARRYVRDPQAHIARLCEQCNYLDAVKLVPWDHYLPSGSTVLDLGCGGGWLTAFLSQSDRVRTIYALDSSRHYLCTMMPEVVQLMGGAIEKVRPIQGLFSPLLFPDAHLDMVVASSAVHHADHLEATLKEVRRVLKPGGTLVLLNEMPWPFVSYLVMLTKAMVRIAGRSLLRSYVPVSQAVSSSGFLSNPLLGDRDYPLWYWKAAITRSGLLLVDHVRTGLPTVKGVAGPPLEHFVCKAV